MPRCPPATVRCSPSPKWKVGREFRWDRLYPRKLGAAGVPLTGAQLKYFCSRIVFCFFKTRINFRKSHCEQDEATGISQALNFKSMMQYLWVVLISRLKIHFLYMSDVRCFTWMLGCFISLVIRQRWQICSVAFKWLRYWRTDLWEWARLSATREGCAKNLLVLGEGLKLLLQQGFPSHSPPCTHHHRLQESLLKMPAHNARAAGTWTQQQACYRWSQ